ncbi:MAG: lysophospholipid acyltransferase family protein [Deferribacterota bacterium]|nr:lysophospholipid acyltransferase family protein [Deferribacterota bacterium]
MLSISFTKLRIKRYSNKIDKSKEYIFMCNHQSFFDTYILFTLLRDFKAVFLLKKELYKIPLMGIVFKKLNYIPIERGKRESSYKSLINAINSIKNGQSVIIYPEGTRSEDGRLLPLKKGGFIIAARSKRDIVPIKIKYRKKIIQSKGSFLINPFQVVDAYIYDPIKSDRADVNELLKKIESLLT